tara:strand:+ start:1493 stop:2002 length:510 start_codon:yes stop_codon:yes gene_type:complete
MSEKDQIIDRLKSLEEKKREKKGTLGPTISFLGVFSMLLFAGWYIGFAQARKLDTAVLRGSNIPEEIIFYRETVTPSFFGYRLEMVRSDQPVYSIGELKQIEENRRLSMSKWKRQQLKMKREIENIEWQQNQDIHKLRVAEVPPHPQRGIISDEEAQALREIGIGEWEN